MSESKDKHTGTIKWFDESKGFGFIKPDYNDNDVFVHFSAIKQPGFRRYHQGERVSYEIEYKTKKVTAINVVNVSSIRTNGEFIDAFVGGIYISEGPINEAERLRELACEFVSEIGYKCTAEGPLKKGSWWGIIKGVFTRTVSKEEVKDRAAIVEDILFGNYSIDTDVKVVEMTVKLVNALEKSASTAAIDAGIFVFLKIPTADGSSSVLAKRLTVRDRSILNNDPSLIQKPIELLDKLKDARAIESKRLKELRGFDLDTLTSQIPTGVDIKT